MTPQAGTDFTHGHARASPLTGAFGVQVVFHRLFPERAVATIALSSCGLGQRLIGEVLRFLPARPQSVADETWSANADLFLRVQREFTQVQNLPLERLLTAAWAEHANCCLQLIFYLGERPRWHERLAFYDAMLWLWKQHPASLLKNLHRLPERGRWGDLCELLARACEGCRLAKARDRAHSYKKMVGAKIPMRDDGVSPFRTGDRLSQAWRALQRYDEDPLYRALFELSAELFATQLKKDLAAEKTGSQISHCARWCPGLDKGFDRRTLLCEGIARKLFPQELHPEFALVEERHYAFLARDRLRREVLVYLRERLADATASCIHPDEENWFAQQGILDNNLPKPLGRRHLDAIQRGTQPPCRELLHAPRMRGHDCHRFRLFLEYVQRETRRHLRPSRSEPLQGAVPNFHVAWTEHRRHLEATLAVIRWVRRANMQPSAKACNGVALGLAVACDTRQSMDQDCAPNLSCRTVAAALALLAADQEGPFKDRALYVGTPGDKVLAGNTLPSRAFEQDVWLRWLLKEYDNTRASPAGFLPLLERMLTIVSADKSGPAVRRLLVISDCDVCATFHQRFANIKWDLAEAKRCFEAEQLLFPDIVFWNLGHCAAPVLVQGPGMVLLSGFSLALLESVLAPHASEWPLDPSLAMAQTLKPFAEVLAVQGCAETRGVLGGCLPGDVVSVVDVPAAKSTTICSTLPALARALVQDPQTSHTFCSPVGWLPRNSAAARHHCESIDLCFLLEPGFAKYNPILAVTSHVKKYVQTLGGCGSFRVAFVRHHAVLRTTYPFHEVSELKSQKAMRWSPPEAPALNGSTVDNYGMNEVHRGLDTALSLNWGASLRFLVWMTGDGSSCPSSHVGLSKYLRGLMRRANLLGVSLLLVHTRCPEAGWNLLERLCRVGDGRIPQLSVMQPDMDEVFKATVGNALLNRIGVVLSHSQDSLQEQESARNLSKISFSLEHVPAVWREVTKLVGKGGRGFWQLQRRLVVAMIKAAGIGVAHALSFGPMAAVSRVWAHADFDIVEGGGFPTVHLSVYGFFPPKVAECAAIFLRKVAHDWFANRLEAQRQRECEISADSATCELIYLNPCLIRFSQAKISPAFRDGRTIVQLVEDCSETLSRGYKVDAQIPPIRVCKYAEAWFTLDNRRLASYRLLSMIFPDRCLQAQCSVCVPNAEEWEKKFSTLTDGREVMVSHSGNKNIIGENPQTTTFDYSILYSRYYNRRRLAAKAPPPPTPSPPPPPMVPVPLASSGQAEEHSKAAPLLLELPCKAPPSVGTQAFTSVPSPAPFFKAPPSVVAQAYTSAPLPPASSGQAQELSKAAPLLLEPPPMKAPPPVGAQAHTSAPLPPARFGQAGELSRAAPFPHTPSIKAPSLTYASSPSQPAPAVEDLLQDFSTQSSDAFRLIRTSFRATVLQGSTDTPYSSVAGPGASDSSTSAHGSDRRKFPNVSNSGSAAIPEIVWEVEEQPAEICPKEAACVAEELWAQRVELFLPVAFGLPPMPCEPVRSRVVLLQFSRHPEPLEQALLSSSIAFAARGQGIDVVPPWANGAKIFVAGVVREQLDVPLGGGELKPWHVLINEDDEDELRAALQHLPYSMRKLKPGGRSIVPHELSLLEVSDEGEHDLVDDAAAGVVIEYFVKGTFLHIGPSLDTRSIRSW